MPARKTRGANLEPQSSEEALDAAQQQLTQGDRYIHGQKAHRHYEEAKRLLNEALTLQADNAEAAYHLGRVQYILATTFEAAPACIASLRGSVAAYRSALAIETTDDASFNLAQSLTTLGENVSDGAIYEKDGELPCWREAIQVLLTTEHLQRAMLNQTELPVDSRKMDETTTDESAEVMTPATIIETLLSLIDVATSLYAATVDVDERLEIWQTLEQALDRAETLDSADANSSSSAIARAKAQAMITRAETDFHSALPLNTIALQTGIGILEQVIAAQVKTSEISIPVEQATEWADAQALAADLLLRFAATIEGDDAGHLRIQGLEHLKQAYDAYTQLVGRLSASLLQADHDVPSHLVPCTLSATQAARSRLLLQLSLSAPDLLESALEVAIMAVEVCGAGLSYRSAERAFVKSTSTAIPPRSDWTTMKALREATLCMARAGFSDLGVVARLLKMSGAVSQQVTAYVEDELKDDAVWRASGGAEQAMWHRVIGALEAEHAVASQIPGR